MTSVRLPVLLGISPPYSKTGTTFRLPTRLSENAPPSSFGRLLPPLLFLVKHPYNRNNVSPSIRLLLDVYPMSALAPRYPCENQSTDIPGKVHLRKLSVPPPIVSEICSFVVPQLLNAVAVLFGIGMLSEPMAFSYAGWIWGTILIIGYGFISCYT